MITSTDNGKIKDIVRLRTKKRFRDEEGLFIAEGETSVCEAPAELIREIYISEGYSGKIPEAQCEVTEVAGRVFEKISDTVTPQGILAVLKKNVTDTEGILGEDNNLPVLFLENLQDPGNLGTIVRMAEAAGVAGIIMSSGTVDIYNPKTVRSTMGSVYRVPFTYCDDFLKAIDNAKKKGIRVYATSPVDSKSFYECDYTKKSAFIIGNESAGISDEVISAADERIMIPMDGKVESLNAAIAATVICFEAKRCRG